MKNNYIRKNNKTILPLRNTWYIELAIKAANLYCQDAQSQEEPYLH